MYKKIIAVALIAAAAVTATSGHAANLNQAASTLSGSDEWSVMAHAAIGHNIGAGYLRSAVNGSAMDYEKRILAVTAVGQNPRTWGNENFVAALLQKFDGTQMGDANLINDDIFGLLALKAAGESGNVVNKLRSHIQANQNSDGGWSFSRGGSSDSNTTAMAVAALRAAGGSAGGGVNYILSTQDANGGFGFTPGQAADGASTAWAVIGLRAAGANVPQNALSYLESLQLPNGAFKWKPQDSAGSDLVTAYSIIALSGKTLPIRTVTNTPPAQPTPTVAGNSANNHQTTPTPAGPAPAIQINNAECVSITAPDRVTAGQVFFATITVKNTGTRSWTTDTTPHRLGSQYPENAHTWGNSRIDLPVQPVQSGAGVTFTFSAKAPHHSGTLPFAWRSLEENVEWFGQTCSKNIVIVSTTTSAPPLAPAPTTTPTPAPQFVPTPTPPLSALQHAQQTNNTFYTTITYPGNKIYVGHTTFNSTHLTASNGRTYSYSSPRAIGTLIAAAQEINLLYEVQGQTAGPFVHTVNGYIPNGASGWLYAVNGALPNVSAADYVLKPGDRVQWYYGAPGASPY